MINCKWKRFWYPRGSELNCYDNHYLPDPEDKEGMAKYFNPFLKTFDEINHINCLILLGEPGIGKTGFLKNEKDQIIKETKKNNSLMIWKDLNDISQTLEIDKYIFETPEYIQWKNGQENLYIYLDSYDECRTPFGILENKIINKIEEVKNNKSRLFIRIACRSSEWPSKLENFLKTVWIEDSYNVYLMAPLRKRDVISAAQINGINSEKLVEEINKKNITFFARIPLLLDSLMALYKENISLPSSKKELLESSCKKICASKKTSAQQQSSDMQLMIVGRIACFSLFSNINKIYIGNDHLLRPSDSLWIEDLIAFDESINGEKVDIIDLGVIKDAINTAFFTSTGPLIVKWVHISQLAFLAAWYLHNKHMDIRKILNVFTNTIDGICKIIPRYKETLSWMCSLCRDLFEEVIKIDPIILAKGDIFIFDVNQKEDIVQSIFNSYEKGNIHPEQLFYMSHLEQLNFPGLENFLKSYIEEKNTDTNLRAFALDLVNECKLSALEQDMIKIVFDKTEFPRMRTIAIEAIGNFGSNENKIQLISLLNLSKEEDPYDEIKGHCLEVLYPGYIEASILFKNIEHRNNHHHFGFFSRFVSYTLPTRLKDEHLIDALDWIKTQPGLHNIDRIYRDLILMIINKSLRMTNAEKIITPLIKTLSDRIKKFDPIFEELNKNDDITLNIEKTIKEKILFYLIEDTDDIPQLYSTITFHSPLLNDIGIKPVVDKLLTENNLEKQDKYIQFVVEWLKWLQNKEDIENVAFIYEAREKNKVLSEKTDIIFRTYQLNTEESNKEKDRYEIIHPKEKTDNKHLNDDKYLEITSYFKKFDESNIQHFEKLAFLIANYGVYPPTNLRTDIVSNEVWSRLNKTEKNIILNSAKNYLISASPKEVNFISARKIPGQAMSLERALILISKLEPNYFETIDPAIYEKWLYYIFSLSRSLDTDYNNRYLQIQKCCFNKSPDKFINALSIIIKEEDYAHQNIFILRDLVFLKGEKYENLIIEKIESDAFHNKSYSSLMDALLLSNKTRAIEYSKKFLQETTPEYDSDSFKKQIYLTCSLLSNYIKDIWVYFWKRIVSSSAFGKDVFTTLASKFYFEISPILHQLSERELKELYLWLNDNFKSEPKPDDDGIYHGGTKSKLWEYKTFTFNEFTERGSRESINVLKEIQRLYPEDKWINNVILKAEDLYLASQPVLSIDTIKSILFNKDKQIIRNSEQLLEYVIEVLEKYQERLHGPTPSVNNLWNTTIEFNSPKDEAALSNDIKRYLEDNLTKEKIIATREPQISNDSKTDILVEHINNENQKITMIIEVKGGWNKNVHKDIQDQLLEKYMKSRSIDTGLYLIGWFDCDKWNEQGDNRKKRHIANFKNMNIDEARVYFNSRANELSGDGYKIKSFILDCTL